MSHPGGKFALSTLSFAFALCLTQLAILATPLLADAQSSLPSPTTPAVPTPYLSKDWRVDSCVASTTAIYLGINHHLEVALEPTGARPLEVKIRPDGAVSPLLLGLKASLDRKETQIYSFAPLGDLFWNIPRGSEALVSYLKREMKFEVVPIDGTPVSTDPKVKPFKFTFSLRGSSGAIAELQKRCNGGKALASDGFERAFLPAVVANVDPSRLNSVETTKLRDLVAQAFAAFRSSNQTQAVINALTAKYVVQLKEYEQLHRNLDRLTHTEIVRLQTSRSTSQGVIDRSTADIPQIRAQIGSTESMLAAANHDLEAANAILDPLLPQIRRLQANVNAAESNLSAAQSNLSAAAAYESQARSRVQDVNNAIGNAERVVSNLQSEADSIRYDVQRARSDVDDARREFDRADSRRRGYDRDGEIRNRMGRETRDGVIDESARGRVERDVDDICREMDREKEDRGRRLRDAENVLERVERRQRDLVNVDIPSAQNEVSRLRSLRSEAESDVRTADSDVSRASAEVRTYEQSVQNAQSKLYSHKKSVGYAEKKSAVQKAEGRVEGLKSDLSKFDREIAKREKLIREENKNLVEIEKQMQAVVAKIKEKEARSNDVQKMLEPYTSEHAVLTSQKSASDQAFATAQSEFAGALRQ